MDNENLCKQPKVKEFVTCTYFDKLGVSYSMSGQPDKPKESHQMVRSLDYMSRWHSFHSHSHPRVTPCHSLLPLMLDTALL